MSIANIPNDQLFVACEEILFSNKAQTWRHVKESIILCFSACAEAGLDIDVIIDSITDDDIQAEARRIKTGGATHG